MSFSALDDDCSWYHMCPHVTPGTSHRSVEVRGGMRRDQLRIAWLGNLPSNCGEAESDHLRTYCQQWLSLSDAAHVMPVPFNSWDGSMPFGKRRAALAFRRSADVLLVPPQCCLVPAQLTSCLRRLDLQPGDPPVVVMLNKVFEGLDVKFAAIHRLAHGRHVLLVTAPAPLNVTSISAALADKGSARTRAPRPDNPSAAGWLPRVAFLGYGAAPAFYGTPSGRPYDYDVGFSGNPGRYDGRYAWRAETMGNAALLARLRAHGTRIYEGGMVGADEYIRTLASTRMWLSTSEAGDHVVTRAYEVLASGRTLLLCDRNARAHVRLGIVERVHAAMFNSSAEFESTVRWYMQHEEERLRMVVAARALADSHTWRARARELVDLIRQQLDAEGAGRARATSHQPTLALKRAGEHRPKPEAVTDGDGWAHGTLRTADAARPFDAPCEAAFVYADSIVRAQDIQIRWPRGTRRRSRTHTRWPGLHVLSVQNSADWPHASVHRHSSIQNVRPAMTST